MSIVSVSRRAGPPQDGHVVATNASDCASGLPSDAAERDVLRQQDRQVPVRHGHDAARRAVDRRDRRAPVALARDEPVAQPVADLAPARRPSPRSRRSRGGWPRTLRASRPSPPSGRGRRRARRACVMRVGIASPSGAAVDRPDRKAVLARELEVALVVGRDAHDGARAVLGEHEVGEPDRDPLARARMHGADARVEPLLLRRLRLALAGATRGARARRSARSPSLPPPGRRSPRRERMLRARARETSRRRACRAAS